MAKDKSSAHHDPLPSARPLYDILGVRHDSDTSSITRAYRRLALQYHPDRNQGDPACTEKFKKIGEAYHILSDEAQRRIYDRTGQLPSGEQTVSPAQRSVEVEDQIRNFFTQYQGSEEEREDFIQQFHATNGDFKKMIFERLLFDNSFPEAEVERLHALGEKELRRATEGAGQSKNEKKLLNSTSLWVSTTTPEKRKKYIHRLKKEKKEAEVALQELLKEQQDHQKQDVEEEDEGRDEKHFKKLGFSGKGKSSGGARNRSMEKKEKNGGGRAGGRRERGSPPSPQVGTDRDNDSTNSSFGALQVMMRDRQRAQWASMVSHMEGKYVTNRNNNKEKEEGTRKKKEGKRKRKRSANEL